VVKCAFDTSGLEYGPVLGYYEYQGREFLH